MRCLSLATAWLLAGHCVVFILKGSRATEYVYGIEHVYLPVTPTSTLSQNEDANLFSKSMASLPYSIDLVVVDKYDLDATWHLLIQPLTRKLMVIDDLANRPYACDILLDQTYGRHRSDYDAWLPSKCLLLLGEKYILLAEQFSIARKTSPTRHYTTHSIQRILISFGAMDRLGLCLQTIKLMLSLDIQMPAIDVMISAMSPHTKALISYQKRSQLDLKLHIDSQFAANLMKKADLAIGSAGISAWERCSVGLPSIVLRLADNQNNVVAALNALGAIMLVSGEGQERLLSLKNAIRNVFLEPNKLQSMSNAAFRVCDASGVNRTMVAIKQYLTQGENIG
ncbi:MAG: UDP-2,4-diacetamido-2,4,6-trideoxy-beta-L-altropyranose hydrolase [Coxiellaceae bacterium]|nr:UDP-2,4-diacetamido-2,4,6-trideoxy-beta-L-altropyranose hydrolase [Coxiellaceae bacterium]